MQAAGVRWHDKCHIPSRRPGPTSFTDIELECPRCGATTAETSSAAVPGREPETGPQRQMSEAPPTSKPAGMDRYFLFLIGLGGTVLVGALLFLVLH